MRTDAIRHFDWSGSIEQLEDRLMMSADPIEGPLSDSYIEQRQLEDYDFTGIGQTVAIIDSGIAYEIGRASCRERV